MSQVLDLPELRAASEQPTAIQRPSKSALFLYGVTVFLSAFLLFQVQLIFAKRILPFFGGVPSVWNTCLFAFQALLLAGYAYAHFLKALAPQQQRRVHTLVLIASAALLFVLWVSWGSPLAFTADWKAGASDNPVWGILKLLGLTVALPFFTLSTTGPLLQSWAARKTVLSSPYRLYALSNAGSLLGLLTYPFLVEWALPIKHQSWLWSCGYFLFAALCSAVALRFAAKPVERDGAIPRGAIEPSETTPVRYALWLGFSVCSSIVLLSATNFMCQNIAAIPLLWVLPLSVYLLTFMLAFDSSRWYSRKVFWALYAVAIGIVLSPHIDPQKSTPIVLIAVYCFTIFVVCMVCHGELARSKPSPEHLTSFYLTIGGGGALGGAIVILIAPLILSGFWEFQGALLLCGFLLFASAVVEDPTGQSEGPTWTPVLVLLLAFLLPFFGSFIPKLSRFTLLNREYWTIPICLVVWLLCRTAISRSRSKRLPADYRSKSASQDATVDSVRFAWQPTTAVLVIGLLGICFFSYVVVLSSRLVFQERNFFGVKYVSKVNEGLVLTSGNTVHGLQLSDPSAHYLPTLYYSPEGGAGTLLRLYPRNANDGHLRIGVIGLGIGSLAAYARAGDYLRFYEIDPAVLGLSLGPRPIFSFLQHSSGHIAVALGDARLSLERELSQGQAAQFDVLVIDAFNSDSVPVHLLTQEAITLYRRHLRGKDGVLAFNISNRFLDLAPVLRGAAAAQDMAIAEVDEVGVSNWVLLSANPAMLQIPGLRGVAKPPAADRRSITWTDDYSNVFQVLRGLRR
ncbi:MAG TPA: hypothetical protein VE077_03675 [Candidatus Methylomirabilis sp.]|nr:hypothetical protein [Candidatus Methylomirabilis sp.]